MFREKRTAELLSRDEEDEILLRMLFILGIMKTKLEKFRKLGRGDSLRLKPPPRVATAPVSRTY